MSLKNKKNGFTLSEVMITMTMIGILSTLTISTIGTSIQKKARLSEFRAAYAKIDAAFRNITVDLGRVYACYNVPPESLINSFGLKVESGTTASSNECALLTQDFSRAVGAIRTCNGKLNTNGCLPDNYPKFSESSATFSNYESDTIKGFVLDNSMIVIMDPDMRAFAVDVNGKKGPNKWGQDIFPFSVKVSESVKVNDNIYVKATSILPLSELGEWGNGSLIKNTEQMMRESAGILAN